MLAAEVLDGALHTGTYLEQAIKVDQTEDVHHVGRHAGKPEIAASMSTLRLRRDQGLKSHATDVGHARHVDDQAARLR